ncbi:MAG TPA: S8 family peptidase [Blastocatellia bacterium]|nr:S8 family peptidase [Blastocatellia bacterium]
MAITIPTPLIEFILLGPLDDRRQLQDSPILGDVWVEFGKRPGEALDLLIAPYRGQHAGEVAAIIHDGLGEREVPADIAYLQGLVVARLKFEEVMRVIVPKTNWWIKKFSRPKGGSPRQGDGKTEADIEGAHEFSSYNPDSIKELITKIFDSAIDWHKKSGTHRLQEMPAFDRFVALTGLILWAGDPGGAKKWPQKPADPILTILTKANKTRMVKLLGELGSKMLKDSARERLVWQVSLNRSAMPALIKSIPAVKADAAKTLFKVDCSDLTWAVIDSGIDGRHPAFLDGEGNSRVKRGFDFKDFRRIVSLSNLNKKTRETNVNLLMKNRETLAHPPRDNKEADEALERLALDARNRGSVHWELVEKFVEIKPNVAETQPQTNHGTHVAGIIGASKKSAERAVEKAVRKEYTDFADGMCPDISLYDFRVLGPEIRDTEFAIIAALQFIRYLNGRDNFLTIHGANLSLSIPHDVRNFACGRTPICEECERLVNSGVVVVAAAGNHGYKSFETKEGSYDSYAAFSITDPGNADGVITVGATHRFWPHTYGVSFFSSRGPTGDGRLKPDLVAPGERIRAPLSGGNVPGGDWGDLDGTSMAAPHVSGAAAMLMARYSELIGQPQRIKKILCESATDLGRERSFQGHGMLDVLRAFQSI